MVIALLIFSSQVNLGVTFYIIRYIAHLYIDQNYKLNYQMKSVASFFFRFDDIDLIFRFSAREENLNLRFEVGFEVN